MQLNEHVIHRNLIIENIFHGDMFCRREFLSLPS